MPSVEQHYDPVLADVALEDGGKLRVSQQWAEQQFATAGFGTVDANAERGFVTIVATR